MVLPSLLKATLRTRPWWPRMGLPMGRPLATFQRIRLLSQAPETMRLPSGLKATLRRESTWPTRGRPRGLPVRTSHS